MMTHPPLDCVLPPEGVGGRFLSRCLCPLVMARPAMGVITCHDDSHNSGRCARARRGGQPFLCQSGLAL